MFSPGIRGKFHIKKLITAIHHTNGLKEVDLIHFLSICRKSDKIQRLFVTTKAKKKKEKTLGQLRIERNILNLLDEHYKNIESKPFT